MVLDDHQLKKIHREVRYAPYSQAQYELLIAFCQARGFEPWDDDVVIVSRPGKGRGRNELVPLVRLQAMRKKVGATGRHVGTLGPSWCGPDHKWTDAWIHEEHGGETPAAAKVGVLRKDHKEPYWGVATWKEAAQYVVDDKGENVLQEHWQKMPALMLAKVGEAFALRKAFPAELAGIYSVEELAAWPRASALQPFIPAAAGEGAEAIGIDDRPVVTIDGDDVAPESEFLFQRRIVSLCECSGRDVAAIVSRMEAKFPTLARRPDRRPFYLAALDELRREKLNGPPTEPEGA